MLTLNSVTAWLDKLDDLGILDELYCSKYFAKVFFGSILSKYFSEILQFARVCVALPRELLGAAAACPVQLRKEATLAGSAPWLEEQTKNSLFAEGTDELSDSQANMKKMKVAATYRYICLL